MQLVWGALLCCMAVACPLPADWAAPTRFLTAATLPSTAFQLPARGNGYLGTGARTVVGGRP